MRPIPRLLLINPNTSADMTERMAALARAGLPSDVEIEARTAAFGAPVIASRAAYAVGAHAALAAYQSAGDGFDAVILGCFGDPGLEALREVSRAPVFGLAEASFKEAETFAAPFAILTLGRAWAAMLQERVLLARVRSALVGVFAGEGTGLDAAREPDAVVARLQALADDAVAAGARTLILGGAALAGLAPRMRSDARRIDGFEAAVRQAAAAMSCPVGVTPVPA